MNLGHNIFNLLNNLNTIDTSGVACFLSKGFPTIDAPPIDESKIKQALTGLHVTYFETLESLNSNLIFGKFKVLLLPYGSAFPAGAWDKIRVFLASGGNLVVLGGSPFHQPVVFKSENNAEDKWVLATAQPSFAHELLIGPADCININEENKIDKIIPVEGSEWETDELIMPSRVYEFTIRLSSRKEVDAEESPDGPKEAIVRPLLHIIDKDGIPIACPIFEIDRLRGSEAGGRWVFAPCNSPLSSKIIRACVDRALEGASELDVRPLNASLFDGEKPKIRIQRKRPGYHRIVESAKKVKINILDKKGNTVFSNEATLKGLSDLRSVEVPIKIKNPLLPGFYNIEVELVDTKIHPRKARSGFWMHDEDLLSKGPKLSVSKDWIKKDDKVFPIVGTTYMASDVHRKFLFEPNPFIWNKDFSLMKKFGVNYVRTGLWAGWSRIMRSPGVIDESVLRALDAYIQTAAKYDIIVCFTFFAFSPPWYGGTNPYIDPRSLEYQKSFISIIAERYQNCRWIHYDLINEPSYSPQNALWQNRPIYDEYEKWAWKEWLKQRHKENLESISDKWRDAKNDPYPLPGLGELYHTSVRDYRQPRKSMDFVLFSQDVLTLWSDSLRNVIKSYAGETLVTLGMDEYNGSARTLQQFHYTSVDYTSIHTWWLNDDILWDGITSKVPEKPNLIQETGLMRLENIDGEHWRTPEKAAQLLERKFAYAFSSRGCGVVQWAWNINPYQPIDNESVIGFIRPDGTAKKEISVIKEYADFFENAKQHLEDYEPDELIILLPHSKAFSGRPNPMESVKRITHTLADRFGIVPTTISEYKFNLERIKDAKLIIIPSAEYLDDSACENLLKIAKAGKKLLFTGSVEGNSYGQLSESFKKLGIESNSIPVEYRESTHWGTQDNKFEFWVTFENKQSEFLKKSIKQKLINFDGNIWHEPLPLELAREEEPLIDLLKNALKSAGIETYTSNVPISTRVLKSKESILIVSVNETSSDAERLIKIDKFNYNIPIKAGRSRLVLIDRKNGEIIQSSSGEQVKVK